MPAKKRSGSTVWIDPDDAPELTADRLAEAWAFKGEQFLCRGPGRPKAEMTKQKISLRLDPDVLARLREGGPGRQSSDRRGYCGRRWGWMVQWWVALKGVPGVQSHGSTEAPDKAPLEQANRSPCPPLSAP
jgi:uncharacterized protein (DUF4415 family)